MKPFGDLEVWFLTSSFEAEGTVQEAILWAWRALDRFNRRSELSTWLHRIATNVYLDMLEGGHRRRVLG